MSSDNSYNYSTQNEPFTFMFDDARHAASLYAMEPPLEPDDLLLNVDQLVDSGIDALFYWAGLEGGTVLYDSKVAQRWGDNVTKWTHHVWYRASRNILDMIDRGYDPLELICQRCNDKGILLIASNWVNFDGGDRETSGGLGRRSDFVYDHPEFQVGNEDDTRARSSGMAPTWRFNFLHEAVRRERFLVFEEFLCKYQTDGIMLDMINFAPFSKFNEVDKLAPILTQWIRDLRKVASEAESQQNRHKRIYVTIPPTQKDWDMLGYEVSTWVSDKLVDGIICQPGLKFSPMDQHFDLSDASNVVNQTECKFFVAFRSLIGRGEQRSATPEMTWAAAANAYSQGADGFGIGDAAWIPNGWPWTKDEYTTLRILGHPDMLNTADKNYRISSLPDGASHPLPWAPGETDYLPKTLVEKKPISLSMRISDNLKHWHQLGRIESVILELRITAIEASLNDVRVEINDHTLPNSILKLSDMTYRLLDIRNPGPYGYIYEYTLTPEFFPDEGENTITVTLDKRDKNIEADFDLYDVDCKIKYNLHKHFRNKPINY